MRKRRDPDRLDVRAIDDKEVFISWLFDEGVSGTLSLTPDTALRLSASLKAAALSTKKDLPSMAEVTEKTTHDG